MLKIFFIRCEKEKTTWKTEITVENITRVVNRPTCCTGYIGQVDQYSYCIVYTGRPVLLLYWIYSTPNVLYIQLDQYFYSTGYSGRPVLLLCWIFYHNFSRFSFQVGNCSPVCSTLCVHGACVSPETCACEAGFSGGSCQVFRHNAF